MLIKRILLKRTMCYFSAFTIFGYLGWYTLGSNNRVTDAESDLKAKQLLAEAFGTHPWSEGYNQFYKYNITRAKGRYGHKTTLITTTNCSKHYFLLILVSSAPSNIERRRDIRQTWGVDRDIKPQWTTVFLVAQSRVQSETDSLLRENNSFGDLVRGDYYDDYWNQTHKIQMGFEWAARYCNFSFLLKTDDDVYVDMKALISNLSEPGTPREKLYLGLLWVKPIVRRCWGDKWEVTKKEYKPDFYPDYCPGFGFVLSADVVVLFVDLFEVVPAFRIDDVYVGMLAKKAGMNGTHHDGFVEKPSPPEVPCRLGNTTVVWHGVTGACLFKLFLESR